MTNTAAAQTSTHHIQGHDIVMPVEIRDARVWSAQFLIPTRAARRVLDPTGLRPQLVLPGRTLCAVGFVRYVDGDLGPYHEFMISLLARRPGVPKSLGAFIHWLPVNQTFTCEAGQTIWGFPKIVADLPITRGRGHTSCAVHVDGQLVMSARIGHGIPAPDALGSPAINAYSYRDGTLRSTPWAMTLSGVRTRLGGARITWGDHPLALELRHLELPTRGLASTSVSRLHMTFHDAVDVPKGVQ